MLYPDILFVQFKIPLELTPESNEYNDLKLSLCRCAIVFQHLLVFLFFCGLKFLLDLRPESNECNDLKPGLCFGMAVRLGL